MSSTKMDFAELEERLGHTFKKPRLLDRALSHRSAVATGQESYERLEFLGDRVLGLVIADMLLQRFPEDPEGHLSRRLNALVRRETLAEVAREVDVGPYIHLGQSEEGIGSENPTILADVCEAVIAALYRDGGMETARAFIMRYWSDRLDRDPTPPRDAKSGLQEWTMGRGLGLPKYEETGRTGPDHAPVFTILVSVVGHGSAEATGKSKRLAEQAAATELLARLSEGEAS